MTASPAQSNQHDKPDYGIDAPPVIIGLSCGALVATAFGVIDYYARGWRFDTFWWLGWAVFMYGEVALMLLYAKVGKFKHRDRMLARIAWRGDERVLDVGTGRGLLMIGAAHHITAGRSVGIDVWSSKDLSGNAAANTLRNAELEGVRDRVEVLSQDASRMEFPDASFDVVVSNLCIHNIPKRVGRDAACREIIRVLKPGGVAIISDYIKTAQYAEVFRQQGADVTLTGRSLGTYPPLRIVEARKNEARKK